MITLVVQGDWLLRRSHYDNLSMTMFHGAERLHCGGFIGFIDKVRKAITDHLVDKVVVVWDGVFDGWEKYDRHPVLKARKEVVWKQRMKLKYEQRSLFSKKEEHEFQINQQRSKLQRHFDSLNIRQIEDERTESMDAIALYVNEAITVGEEIILLSRDHEFLQLISEDVSVLRYDDVKVTHDHFLDMYGYHYTNDLMIKCFVGMPPGLVNGVKRLTLKGMLKYFTGLKLEHYSYDDLISYSRRKRIDARLVIYDMVLSANDILRRNARLINLQNPLSNNNLNEQKNYCLYSPLKEGRVDDLVQRYEADNYKTHVKDDINAYFEPFQRILLKENEYRTFHEQINI